MLPRRLRPHGSTTAAPRWHAFTALAPLLVTAVLSCSDGRDTSNPEKVDARLDAGPQQGGANVLVVSFDALRADALGLYGYPRPTSPNLDRFAAEAVVFERAFSAAPVTPTSFAAAFTSRLPTTSFRGWRLEELPTLAEAFRAAGWRTGAILNNSQLTAERGFDRGFDTYRLPSMADEEILAEAARWLENVAGERFFGWVHFISPHSPYDRRAGSSHFYEADYDGDYRDTSTADFAPDSPGELARIRDLYDGEIFFADQLFGRLLDRIGELDLLDDTIVVVTSDHGEEFGERGYFQHVTLHDESARIPLLIRYPGGSPAGRDDRTASNLDLWPTLAAAVGVQPPGSSDGVDLLGSPRPGRTVVGAAMTDGRYRGLSVTRDGWRLIADCLPERATHLYDRASDPAELESVSAAHPERVRTLFAYLRTTLGAQPCVQLHAAIQGASPTEGLAEETVENLRALGYVD